MLMPISRGEVGGNALAWRYRVRLRPGLEIQVRLVLTSLFLQAKRLNVNVNLLV
jgi:hypothetical protein